jgi:hypothetical protein
MDAIARAFLPYLCPSTAGGDDDPATNASVSNPSRLRIIIYLSPADDSH